MGALRVYASFAKMKFNDFMSDERGDTNFISIIVILGIVIVVAGVFIAFGGNVIDWVNNNLLENSGLSSNPSMGDNKLSELTGKK